ncbi:hypothetical protein SBF1_1480006 [Candidatus Desulfosporosinus infrequens]|uniref:Uncharacterized protein n=1 Tax=Candidatus Desulfosporosinus infrequens TaxID=2043169 RepID=A0A2U3K6M4_9FIRM|nr:hypothetical protein SBF1_1480006 [Candidatus Desulfosporosinus infrequens]
MCLRPSIYNRGLFLLLTYDILSLGEFKGGGFMDSGPYHPCTTILDYIGWSHFYNRCQAPSLKGGK